MKRILIALFLLVALAVGWWFVWDRGAQRAEAELASFVAAQQSKGATLTYDSKRINGFPLNHNILLENVVWEKTDAYEDTSGVSVPVKTRIQALWIGGQHSVLQPGTFNLAFPPEMTLTFGPMGDEVIAPLLSQNLRASVKQKGDMIHFSADAESLVYGVEQSHADRGRIKLDNRFRNFHAKGQIPEETLRVGLQRLPKGIDVAYRVGETDTVMESTGGGTDFRIVAKTQSVDGRYQITEDTLSAQADVKATTYSFTRSDTGATFEGTMGALIYDALMPVQMAPQTDAPMRLDLTLGDLTLSEDLWALFDPTQAFPRDPAHLRIRVHGQMQRFSALDEGATPPPLNSFETLQIDEFDLSIAGARAQASGSFELSNPASPEGGITLTLYGWKDFVQNGVKAGLVKPQQAFMAQTMVGGMAKEGPEPGSAVLELAVTNGLATLNGIPLGPLALPGAGR